MNGQKIKLFVMTLRRNTLLLFFIAFALSGKSQDAWKVVADDINPKEYYGVTVANGMVGLVSSPRPMKVNDVILNGVYDYYQRGRVSNILKVFNHMNMDLDIGHPRCRLYLLLDASL